MENDQVQVADPANLQQVPQVPLLPNKVLIRDIDRKSQDYNMYHHAWELMYWLYIGGVEIEGNAEQYLKRRPKELSDVYQARIENWRYQNHVGQAIDWYLAALFEDPPEIEPALDADAVTAGTLPGDVLSDDDTKFYNSFDSNCDKANTPFLEHVREYFKNLLIFGRAATLIDLPPGGNYANLDEQIKAGALNPYLVEWDSQQIINFSKDRTGNLQWIILSARETVAPTPFGKVKTVDHWYYFDTEQFAIYEREVPEGEKICPDDATAVLASVGRHALADQKRVPVIFTELRKGLWLMNRAYSSIKDHLNTDNVLGWALTMAALAMPVVMCDGDFTLTLTEAGFIKLPKGATYQWSEPEGKSFVHLADRTLTLKEEIFRAFYLIAQARSTGATPQAQSGVSKQQDYSASKKILNMFGDVMRQVIQQLYDAVSLARKNDVSWDVRGLQFPEDPPNETLDMIAAAQALGIPSDEYEKEMYKLAVVKTLPDANPAKRKQIFDEIDKAPNSQDREIDAMKQQAQALVTTKMTSSNFGGA